MAAELAEPVGRGVVGIFEEVVAGGVAADGDGVRLADADVVPVAGPAGVEFAAEAVGFGAFDGEACGAGAAGLPRTEGAVGRRAQGASGEGAGAEAGTGAEERENFFSHGWGKINGLDYVWARDPRPYKFASEDISGELFPAGTGGRKAGDRLPRQPTDSGGR